MAKKISFGLSVREVQEAIKELKTYQGELNRKCEELCRRLTAEGIQIAQSHIGSSGFGKYIHLGSEITPQQAGCKPSAAPAPPDGRACARPRCPGPQ